MRTFSSVAMAAVAVTMVLGCTQKPPVTAMAVGDKVYTVAPDRVVVRAGIVTGEVTELKVTERVEQGTGRIDSPAKLSGKIKLTNSSVDQTVRLVAGTLQYIDVRGQPIKMEETRTEPVIRFTASGSEQLQPGQEVTQSVDVDFPAAALKLKELKEIRFSLAYVPTPYRQETASFAVAIGGQ